MGDSAMNTAVSALKAQSSALSVISQNLANSSTTGYKASSTSFYDMVVQQNYNTTLLSGGVSAVTSQYVNTQGVINSATSTTDLALDGSGMFAVSKGLDGGQTYYTRDGEFTTDSSGYLVLSGTDYYLEGWPVDASGDVTATNSSSLASLEPVNVEKYNTTATATSNVSLKANLPAEAQSDYTSYASGFTTTLTVYDSLGSAQYVDVTFIPQSNNTWEMDVSYPVDADGNATTSSGTGTSSTHTVTFDSSGNLDTVDGSSTSGTVSLSITGWTDGAADSTIALNLGTIGSTGGLSQYNSGETSPAISIKSISQDGVAYGQLESVSVSSSGIVTAKYSNGESVPIYKIPVVSFASYDGLKALSSNVYESTTASGDPILNTAGTNGTGNVEGGALEASTVDTSKEFSNMIVCQQAYSAAAQIISTDKEMYSALLNVVQ